MPRQVPEPLYQQVLALVSDIAQPEVREEEHFVQARAEDSYKQLLELYQRRESAGKPDPFLTEALADMTDNRELAVHLYQAAIDQCRKFPGEPVVSKRIGLARQLISMGRKTEAQTQIEVARRDAFSEHDIEAIKEIEGLLVKEPI
jgi:hypothetical protein